MTGDQFLDGEAAGAEEAGPPALLPSVVQALGEAGLTEADYARHHYCEDGQWAGDRCGCPDDRCIGFHHFAEDDCGCFPVLLGQALDELASRGRLPAEGLQAQAHAVVQEAGPSHPSWPAADKVAEVATDHAIDDVQAELGEAGL